MRRQVLEQAVKLKHHADLAPQGLERRLRRVVTALQRDAVDEDPPVLKSLEPGDRAQDRRLARSRRSHHGDDFAASDLQMHAVQNRPRAAAQAEIGDVEHGLP